jgi:hypothetical protein
MTWVAKPTEDHTALVMRRNVQCCFGIKFKAKMLEGEIVVIIGAYNFRM